MKLQPRLIIEIDMDDAKPTDALSKSKPETFKTENDLRNEESLFDKKGHLISSPEVNSVPEARKENAKPPVECGLGLAAQTYSQPSQITGLPEQTSPTFQEDTYSVDLNVFGRSPGAGKSYKINKRIFLEYAMLPTIVEYSGYPGQGKSMDHLHLLLDSDKLLDGFMQRRRRGDL